MSSFTIQKLTNLRRNELNWLYMFVYIHLLYIDSCPILYKLLTMYNYFLTTRV